MPTEDCLPFLPRNHTTAASEVQRMKEEVALKFVEAAHRKNLRILVSASDPFAEQDRVIIETWKEAAVGPEFTYRSLCNVDVVPMDHHRYRWEFQILIDTPKTRRTKRWRRVIALSPTQIEDLLTAMIAGSSFPKLARVREHGWQIWRPKNKVDAVRTDWERLAVCGAVAAIGLFIAMLLPLTIALAGLIWYLWPKPTLTYSPGRPVEDPIRELDLDQWAASIRGLAADAPEFERVLVNDLRHSLPRGGTVRTRRENYIGEDEVIVRDRILVRFRRSLVFIDIEAYGGELFVGWESAVNAGTWAEVTSSSGVHRQQAVRCAVKQIRKGWWVPQRRDIQDAIFLGELVHSKVRYWVQHYTDLRKVQDRIDFEVRMGDRDRIVGRADPGERKRSTKRFARVE